MSFKQLKQAKVETISGIELGKIVDFVIDIDTHSIVQYEVKSSLLDISHLLINQSQIVSFTEGKVIVEDSAYGAAQKERKTVKGKVVPGNVKPLLMREE